MAETLIDMVKQMRTLRGILLPNFICKFPLSSLDYKINKRTKAYKEFAYEAIRERRRNIHKTYENDPERKDLLQILLE
jgi:hypothetical protein